ncbi:MAG: YbhB/YbcL family Raf kinase inhibitor-like protein [Chloroflexi bacterium]|nr:YbhB/YbcL family Raf kinase inhibitor-like protein [Chloroflexota bacterium]
MKKTIFFIVVGAITVALIALIAVLFLMGPTHGETFSSSIQMPPPSVGFVLISPDFIDGGPIPARFTCDGENIPPSLAWGESPAGTKSYVLIVDDPDAPLGTWTHWIVYNIPAETRTIDSLIRPGVQINNVAILFGKNSWGIQAYSGPCPPSGTHHYVFHLYALDIMLGPEDKVSKNELTIRMQGHILSYAELTGTYTK